MCWRERELLKKGEGIGKEEKERIGGRVGFAGVVEREEGKQGKGTGEKSRDWKGLKSHPLRLENDV